LKILKGNANGKIILMIKNTSKLGNNIAKNGKKIMEKESASSKNSFVME
jgi:hypothetical protein